MLIPRLTLGILASLCAFASQATAATYDALYAFGDSTVDSGWWQGALASPPRCDGLATTSCATGNTGKNTLISSAILNGATGAPVGAGFMNNVQDLAAKFGLTANPANSPGGGTDYAISGALSAPAPNLPPNPSSPDIGNLNPNMNLPSTMTQIANFITSHPTGVDPSALYVISSGGNDVTYANTNTNFTMLAQKEAFLLTQATALAGEISALQTAGAKSIVVYGLQGSGTLPTYMTTQLFNQLTLDHVNFAGIDIAGLIAAVQANPSAYDPALITTSLGVVGTSTGSACVTETGAGATTTGWGQWCANTGISSTNAYLNPNLTNPEQQALFTDDQHLSAAGQQIEANFVFDQITGTPLPAALPLFATGIGGLGLLGWHRKRKAQAVD